MNPELWQQIDKLFHAVLACKQTERAEFLANACAGDEALRSEIESLIANHEDGDSFIETDAGDIAADLLSSHKSIFEPGQQIENYRIIRHLGSGGMGDVYLADDTRLHRKIALKLLPPHFTVNPDRVRRFAREARAASALNHPNIVTIYEIGQSDSAHFLAAEFVDGKTLRQMINESPLKLGEALNVAIQVAGALKGAHAAGIIHRDIKPENIMVRTDGYVKILDFGLAKLTEQHTADSDLETPTLLQSNPGLVMGTVQYMSPEQARGQTVDARTDIWALGIVLYELLAGRVPFSGETASHVMVSLMENELPGLRDHANVPAELEAIVTKALRKNPKERYQDASQLASHLKTFKRTLQLEASLKDSLEAFPRREKPTGAMTGAPASSLAVGSATGTVALQSTTTRPTSSTDYVIKEIKNHKPPLLLAAAMLAMLAVIVGYFYFGARTRSAAKAEAIDSIAVLPFVNVGNNPDNEYVSEGISDGIINSLSGLSNLRVLRYRGKQADPQTIGHELNVRAVLVGKLAQNPDGVSFTAELVDIKNNRQLWTRQYNHKPSDILVVEREIARDLAEEVRPTRTELEKQRATKHYTESKEAYAAYARGRYFLNKRTRETSEKSIECFEQAIKLDPNYALAYTALADAYLSLRSLGTAAPQEEVLSNAKWAVDKALAIDNNLAEAHAALGSIRVIEWNWQAAEVEFKRAQEIDHRPSQFGPHYLLVMKRSDEAVAESKRILEEDPVCVVCSRNLAMVLYYTRRYDEAIEQSLKTVELDPNMKTAYNWLGRSYEQKGLYDQAVETYLKSTDFGPVEPGEAVVLRQTYAASGWKGFWRKVRDLIKEKARQHPDFKGYLDAHTLAKISVRLGEKDQAFVWLEKMYEERSAGVLTINTDPLWDSLRSDPRYTDLVRRMGLEP